LPFRDTLSAADPPSFEDLQEGPCDVRHEGAKMVVPLGSDPFLHGRDFGSSIDIQAGLHGNETIVKQPTVSLQEGQLVTPIEPPKPSGG
jgi:hypothetical protein